MLTKELIYFFLQINSAEVYNKFFKRKKMNFLAHLYLSDDIEEIIVGNILADMLKGQNISKFNEKIVKGIELHRKIDKFTDQHHVVNKTKQRLRPLFKHYSPVVVDVYYDHFLAVNWKDYSEIPLKEFANNCYNVLRKHKELFPFRFKQALKYHRFRKLLTSYTEIKGIRFAFKRLENRSMYISNLHLAPKELERNYFLYYEEFREFFEDLKDFTGKQIKG